MINNKVIFKGGKILGQKHYIYNCIRNYAKKYILKKEIRNRYLTDQYKVPYLIHLYVFSFLENDRPT